MKYMIQPFRLVLFVIIILFFSGLILQCGSKKGKEIIIGTHIPLTGIGAGVVIEQKWAYEQAVKDINEAGGIFVKEYGSRLKVRLVIIDDQSDAGKAAEAVEELITEKKVDLLLSGQNGAMGVLPGMITAEKYRKYYHGTLMWPENYLEQDFQWCTLYIFDMDKYVSMFFELWNSLPEDKRPEKPCIFIENSFDGKLMSNAWYNHAKRYGYNIVLQEFLEMGGKNFTPQVLNARQKNIDAVLCLANTPETVSLIRQMKNYNCNFDFFIGLKGAWSIEFYNALGKDSDYVVCDGFWSEDYPFNGAKELGDRFYNKYKQRSLSVGLFYALCQTLFQAIEKAGTIDSAGVRRAVLANSFNTVNGRVDYNDRGIALFINGCFQWMDGERRNVYPLDLAKYKLAPAPAWKER
jgi:branched-chain amino acid transport system substrate-binding protein